MIESLLFVGLAWWMWRKFQPPPTVAPLQPCQIERIDGPYRICLNRDAQGLWTWSATRAGEPQIVGDGTQPTEDDALVDAWVQLAPNDIGGKVLSEPTPERGGMKVATDGTLTVTNAAVYTNDAAQKITQAEASGDDALGVVGGLLIKTFGSNWNPLRVTIAGGTIWDAAKRYTDEAADAGTTPQKKARAIAGLP